MARENLAAVEDNDEAPAKGKRKPQAPRPLIVVFKKEPGPDGAPEVVDVTRNPFEVMDMVEKDPSLTYKRIDKKIGR